MNCSCAGVICRVRTGPIESGGVSFCQRSRSALRSATIAFIGRGCDASSVSSARLRLNTSFADSITPASTSLRPIATSGARSVP